MRGLTKEERELLTRIGRIPCRDGDCGPNSRYIYALPDGTPGPGWVLGSRLAQRGLIVLGARQCLLRPNWTHSVLTDLGRLALRLPSGEMTVTP